MIKRISGTINDSGEAKPFPPLKLAGSGNRFIVCPACGERLDKENLGELLEHEERCGRDAG